MDNLTGDERLRGKKYAGRGGYQCIPRISEELHRPNCHGELPAPDNCAVIGRVSEVRCISVPLPA